MARLANIAFDMEQAVLRNGLAYRELNHGLRLQLNLFEGEKTLTLSRPAVPPGEAEVEICRRLFAVPPDAVRTDGGTEVSFQWTP